MKKTSFAKGARRVGIQKPSFAEDQSEPQKSAGASSCASNIANYNTVDGVGINVINSHKYISFGLKDADKMLGGGPQLGSLTLIEEDENTSNYSVLLKYFLVDGVMTKGHYTLLAGADRPPHSVFKNSLPAQYGNLEKQKQLDKPNQDGSKMKIAWRYEGNEGNSPSQHEEMLQKRSYDLAKVHQLTQEQEDRIFSIDVGELSIKFQSSNLYQELFKSIEELRNKLAAKTDEILRIVIKGLGSPLWNISGNKDEKCREMLLFLRRLRFFSKQYDRSSQGPATVFVISIPMYRFDITDRDRIRSIFDAVIGIRTFNDQFEEAVTTAYKPYDGIMTVRSMSLESSMLPLPSLIALSSCTLTNEYVFKRKKHKMTIEVFSLPPDLSRAGNTAGQEDEQSKSRQTKAQMCGGASNGKSELDF